MIAYVPPYRYKGRNEPRPNKGSYGYSSERVRQWYQSRRYGAIYNLRDDTTRPATKEEYEKRDRYKIFPTDFKNLKKIETGNWR